MDCSQAISIARAERGANQFSKPLLASNELSKTVYHLEKTDYPLCLLSLKNNNTTLGCGQLLLHFLRSGLA